MSLEKYNKTNLSMTAKRPRADIDASTFNIKAFNQTELD